MHYKHVLLLHCMSLYVISSLSAMDYYLQLTCIGVYEHNFRQVPYIGIYDKQEC